MKRIRFMIICLAGIFLTVGTLYAQPQGEMKNHGDKHQEGIFKELNLTPEQNKQLTENRKVQREEMIKLHTTMKEQQAKLQETLKDPSVTKTKVEPLVNEMKSLQAQLIDHRVNGIFAVKQILTPEQFAKFQEMMGKRGEGRKDRFQNWSGKEQKTHQNKE